MALTPLGGRLADSVKIARVQRGTGEVNPYFNL